MVLPAWNRPRTHLPSSEHGTPLSRNYFGQAIAPTNVSLAGPTTCDGVGAAGDFGRGSEIFWTTSCLAACSSPLGEEATTAVGAVMPEACASSAWPSQLNCSDQFAIIALAAPPYDCHPDVAATPRQNAITKRKMVRPRISDGPAKPCWASSAAHRPILLFGIVR